MGLGRSSLLRNSSSGIGNYYGNGEQSYPQRAFRRKCSQLESKSLYFKSARGMPIELVRSELERRGIPQFFQVHLCARCLRLQPARRDDPRRSLPRAALSCLALEIASIRTQYHFRRFAASSSPGLRSIAGSSPGISLRPRQYFCRRNFTRSRTHALCPMHLLLPMRAMETKVYVRV